MIVSSSVKGTPHIHFYVKSKFLSVVVKEHPRAVHFQHVTSNYSLKFLNMGSPSVSLHAESTVVDTVLVEDALIH